MLDFTGVVGVLLVIPAHDPAHGRRILERLERETNLTTETQSTQSEAPLRH